MLYGCEYYESAVPLTDSSRSVIDTALTGRWVNASEKDADTSDYFDIIPFNKTEYIVKAPVFHNSKFESVYLFKMHNTVLKDNEIFNLLSLNLEESNMYTFYKYEKLADGLIMVYYLSGKELKSKFNDSKELYKFFKAFPDSINSSFKEFALIRKVPVQKNKL